jgi:hypothetical protein
MEVKRANADYTSPDDQVAFDKLAVAVICASRPEWRLETAEITAERLIENAIELAKLHRQGKVEEGDGNSIIVAEINAFKTLRLSIETEW